MTVHYLYVLLFPNGKRYFGISKNVASRFKGHLRAATKGVDQRPLYRAMRKNVGQVVHQTLCVGSEDYIADLEILAIARWNTTDRRYGYNLALGGNTSPMSSPGVAKRSRDLMWITDGVVSKKIFKHVPIPVGWFLGRAPGAWREEMVVRFKDKPFSEERKVKLRGRTPWNKGTRGRIRSTPKSLAALATGREQRLQQIKAGDYHQVPYERTPESRARSRDAQLARPPRGPLSEEHKANVGRALKGRPSPRKGIPLSPEHCVNIKIGMKNGKRRRDHTVFTAEHKAHLAIARLQLYAMKRCGKIPETHPAYKFGPGSSAGFLF